MIKIRGVEIGTGRPKICVPITGTTKEEIFEQARKIALLNVEIVEWRADYSEFIGVEKEVKEVLKQLRAILGDKIILFTFRSKREGGEQQLEEKDYAKLNIFAAETNLIDLADIEFYTEQDLKQECIQKIHKTGCKIILSNHDFNKTPDKAEITDRLLKMEKDGADIVKIAVMPKTPSDVAVLLGATCEAADLVSCPVVTMSMSKLGVVSRIAGGVFGSAITFATAGAASAPGQIPVEDLKMCLDLISQ